MPTRARRGEARSRATELTRRTATPIRYARLARTAALVHEATRGRMALLSLQSAESGWAAGRWRARARVRGCSCIPRTAHTKQALACGHETPWWCAHATCVCAAKATRVHASQDPARAAACGVRHGAPREGLFRRLRARWRASKCRAALHRADTIAGGY